MKSVGNFVAKTVLVESANQNSLEELCRIQYSLKYFFRSHVDHQTYGKTLTYTDSKVISYIFLIIAIFIFKYLLKYLSGHCHFVIFCHVYVFVYYMSLLFVLSL